MNAVSTNGAGLGVGVSGLRSAAARSFLILGFMFLLLFGTANWYSLATVQIDRLDGHTASSIGEDYVVFYTAGRFVVEGRGEDLYDIKAVTAAQIETMGRPVGGSGVLPYLNPPFVALFFAPISLLPLGLFSGVLFLVEVAFLFAAGYALLRLIEPESSARRIAFWVIYLTSTSTIWIVLQQQLSFFLFFGWFGLAWYMGRGRDLSAGAAFALALVKPHVVLVPTVVLLWKRQWKTLGAFAAVAAALALVSVLIAGPSVLWEYPKSLLENGRREGVNTTTMFGWNGFWASLIGDETPHAVLMLPFALPALAALVWAWAPSDAAHSQERHLVMGVTLTASLLLNPHLHLQDMVLLTLAVSLGAAFTLAKTGRLGAWGPIAVASWIVQLYALRLQADAGIPVSTIMIAIVFAVFVWSLAQARQRAVVLPALSEDHAVEVNAVAA